MNPLINGLNTLLKTRYIAVLIKVLFEFTGFFKLQIVINNLFSFNTGLSIYFQYWLVCLQVDGLVTAGGGGGGGSGRVVTYKRKFIGIYMYFFLFTVKCPIGTYYNASSSTCKNCPIGYFSTVEGATMCQQCPGNTSTPEEGSKTCTGNYVFLHALRIL